MIQPEIQIAAFFKNFTFIECYAMFILLLLRFPNQFSILLNILCNTAFYFIESKLRHSVSFSF